MVQAENHAANPGILGGQPGYVAGVKTYAMPKPFAKLLKSKPSSGRSRSKARLFALEALCHERLWERPTPKDMNSLSLRCGRWSRWIGCLSSFRLHAGPVGEGNQTDHRRAMRPVGHVRGRWSLRPL